MSKIAEDKVDVKAAKPLILPPLKKYAKANFIGIHNYSEAVALYDKEEIKSSEFEFFKMTLGSNKEQIYTYVDPGLSPEEKLKPENQVTYRVNPETNKIQEITIGKNVSCVLPPEKTDGKAFSMKVFEKGKQSAVLQCNGQGTIEIGVGNGQLKKLFNQAFQQQQHPTATPGKVVVGTLVKLPPQNSTIQDFAQVKTYDEGIKKYNEIPSERKFIALQNTVDEKTGVRTIIYADPRITDEKQKQNPANHVKYTIDKNNNVQINVGSNVSCILPPKRTAVGFEMMQVSPGNQNSYLIGDGKKTVIAKDFATLQAAQAQANLTYSQLQVAQPQANLARSQQQVNTSGLRPSNTPSNPNKNPGQRSASI